VRITFALAAALTALAACGAEPAGSPGGGSAQTTTTPTYENARWGYTVSIPPGWHRAEEPLSATTEPVEILAVATYRARAGDEDCGPLVFGGFDSGEVLVTILERGLGPESEWPDFPPRPAHFEFEPGLTSESADCFGATRHVALRSHWFNFTDVGRHFHVLVAIGADAPAARAREAYRMIDSLRLDPSVKPGWRSSG
jgi:hypothetical protein